MTPTSGTLRLFVVGRFGCNEVLLGARGYRRTLVEAGRVLEQVLMQARQFGLRATSSFEFFDRVLDEVIEADGTEEGIVAVVHLDGVTDDS
jgi:hypothetical protein